MEKRKPITEDDLLLTELLITRSFENLKQSAVRTTSRSLRSAGGTLRQHPYAVAGAAVGAGILLFGLFKLMNRGSSSRGRGAGLREQGSGLGMNKEILSLIMPMITPYITAYIQKNLGRMFHKDHS